MSVDCKKSHNNIMLEGIKNLSSVFFGFASSTDTIEIIILYLTEHLRRHFQQRPFKVDSENYFIRSLHCFVGTRTTILTFFFNI